VVLAATNEAALQVLDLDTLKAHAVDASSAEDSDPGDGE
jgi:hypothetical protein